MKRKPVEIIVSALEDSFQSISSYRLQFSEFVPAYEAAIHAGLRRFEHGGRYRSIDFWSGESPFDSMRAMRSLLGRDATIMSTGRSKDVLGTKTQPSDIIALYARLMSKYGIDVVRNLDPLNDAENFVRPGQCLQEKGIGHEVVILLSAQPLAGSDYSKVPIHMPEHYRELLIRVLNSGVPLQSVAFLDPFGMSLPGTIQQIIQVSRQLLPPEVAISFQTNNRSGPSTLSYLAAIEGGADAVGLSLGSAPGGMNRPEMSLISRALRPKEQRLMVDAIRLEEVEKVFRECAKKHVERIREEDARGVEEESGLTGAEGLPHKKLDGEAINRYSNLVREMNDVVEFGGFAVPVRPISEFYFEQAMLNVQLRPWERIDPNYAKLILGYFGKTPVKPDPGIMAIARGELKMGTSSIHPVERADLDPSKGIKAALTLLESSELPAKDENILQAATSIHAIG